MLHDPFICKKKESITITSTGALTPHTGEMYCTLFFKEKLTHKRITTKVVLPVSKLEILCSNLGACMSLREGYCTVYTV